MATLDHLVERVFRALEGGSIDQGQLSWLVNPLNIGDYDLYYAEQATPAQGVNEVGDELVWIAAIDDTNNWATIAPFGRGYRGTTEANHGISTVVRTAPTYYRSEVIEKINEAIVGVYPTVWGIGVTTVVPNGSQATYPLPLAAEEVLEVTSDSLGPSGTWPAVNRYVFDRNAPVSDYVTGRTITFSGPMDPGQKVNVVYKAKPKQLVTGQDFTLSGLSDTAVGLIVYGTLYRLLMDPDNGRVGGDSAQAATIDGRQGGPSATAGQRYYALYQQELTLERDRLNALTPGNLVWME